MTEDELTTRIETVLATLHDDADVTDAQIAEAISNATDVTGLVLPTTDAHEIAALMNRAKRFVFQCVMSDWMTRFDYSVGSTSVTAMSGESYRRSQVFQNLDKVVRLLDQEFYEHLRSVVVGADKSITNRTAYRP